VSIRIVTDSTCDLPEQVVERYGITVLPLYVNIGTQSYLDVVDLSREQFYARLPDYHPPPTTAVPGQEAFGRVYQELLEQGADQILSIHIATRLSMMTNVARSAVEHLDAPVTVFDSGQITLGTGFLVLDAARAAAEGRPMPEILAMLEQKRARITSFAALDTLEFMRRGGRLSPLQARLGSLLRIKPLLIMHDGDMDMQPLRTRRRARERLIRQISELAPFEQVGLVHAGALDEVEVLRGQIAHLLPPEGVSFSVQVTPVIGAHVGPGAVGAVCVQAERS